VLSVGPDLFGQEYTWWNKKHNWDGVTSWKKYLNTTPAFMGPNALPLPEIHKGRVRDRYYLEIAPEFHFSRGDQTFDVFTRFDWPVSPGKVNIGVSYVPFEIFRMDTLTRDERAARDYDGKGHSFGDIYVHTQIQLIKNRDKWPDIMLSANIKTASGTNLGSARHTDAPGYYFDISAGKDFPSRHPSIISLRPYILVGFYAYQTHHSDYLQNDCFLLGGGLDLRLSKLIISNKLGAYAGYFNDGDRPFLYRLIISDSKQKPLSWSIRYQQGINDFKYSTFRVSAIVNFNKWLGLKAN
jgi:hypothetical protein